MFFYGSMSEALVGISQKLLLVSYANTEVLTELEDYLLKGICIAAGFLFFPLISR